MEDQQHDDVDAANEDDVHATATAAVNLLHDNDNNNNNASQVLNHHHQEQEHQQHHSPEDDDDDEQHQQDQEEADVEQEDEEEEEECIHDDDDDDADFKPPSLAFDSLHPTTSATNTLNAANTSSPPAAPAPAPQPEHQSFLLDDDEDLANASGSEDQQSSFMKHLESFCKNNSVDFKPLKFYGEPLNLLKLYRYVIRLGGYDKVTSCKLWRQVGESFRPPKTCTTVSWTFRVFYEKSLLEFEKHEMHRGELPFHDASLAEPGSNHNQVVAVQGSGRARRDSAARAMQGWHSQRNLGNGDVGEPVIKDKSSFSTPKREKQLKSVGLLKRKNPSPVERAVKVSRMKSLKPQEDSMVVDAGPPADWVKINVRKTKDCYEVYALVPGLLREEVRVQSDPMGRLVISGEPEHLDNPWGVTPFKKVVSLPSRIDPHQTSAVVTLHGQLFVRVPFEPSDL